MEDIILLVIRALAGSGKSYIIKLLGKLEDTVANSPNEIDNELFKMVIDSIKEFEPKN